MHGGFDLRGKMISALITIAFAGSVISPTLQSDFRVTVFEQAVLTSTTLDAHPDCAGFSLKVGKNNLQNQPIARSQGALRDS